MKRFLISEEEHGYVVRDEVHTGLIGKIWAYSSLTEALHGLNELLTEQVNDGGQQ